MKSFLQTYKFVQTEVNGINIKRWSLFLIFWHYLFIEICLHSCQQSWYCKSIRKRPMFILLIFISLVCLPKKIQFIFNSLLALIYHRKSQVLFFVATQSRINTNFQHILGGYVGQLWKGWKEEVGKNYFQCWPQVITKQIQFSSLFSFTPCTFKIRTFLFR